MVVTTPLRTRPPRFSTIRCRSISVKADEAEISNRNSARECARLACCPPGPPAGPNVHDSSRAGITWPRSRERSWFASGITARETNQVNDSERKQNPWKLAARPHTLWAAIAPVAVGGGLAAGSDAFRIDAFVVALIGAVAIQIAANFANDASDAKRGADPAQRIGPTRAVSSGLLTSRQMWTGTWAAFAVAAAAGAYLTLITSWIIIAIGVASIVATLGYVGGPVPYGYRGLGEVFVFVFFGLVATVASRYVHDQTAPLEAWLLAIPIGFMVAAILVANNVRDIETDAVTGKRTLAVMMGLEPSRRLFAVLVYGTFTLIGAFAVVGATPTRTVLAVLAIPLARPLVKTLSTTREGPALIGVLQGTARLHLLVALAVAVGAVVS